MSYFSGENLIVRLREVLEDARGTLRTISANTFEGQFPPGLEVGEEARRAFGNPRAEATVSSVARSAASPPVIGNIALYDIGVDVRVAYPLTSAAWVVDAVRDSAVGAAYKAADVVAQALTYPGNLTTTQAGAATGVVSGMLAFVKSDIRSTGSDQTGGIVEAMLRFKGVVQSAPAVS